MASDWESLSWKYESAQVRGDSLDALVEWPAQLRAVGDVRGKRVLDIGCGSGRKALYFALAGAKSVVGIDISNSFIAPWQSRDKPKSLEFFVGDRGRLSEIAEIRGREFDLVTGFQALGVSAKAHELFSSIRRFQPEGGRFVFSTPHPFRYVTLRVETDRVPPAVAYRNEQTYSYPSTWHSSVTITDQTPTISTVVNSLRSAGYRLDRMAEPGLTEEQHAAFPRAAEWMDKYFGIMLYEATAV